MASMNSIGSNKPIEVALGGTGANTLTDHGVLVGSSTGAVTPLTVGTNGQVLLGSSASDPVFATLASADATIGYTAGAGTLDIKVSGLLPTINAQTGTTYQFVLSDAGKLVTLTNGAAITLTVPAYATVALEIGTTILIAQGDAGVVTVTPAGTVTVNSRGALLDTAGQYAMATLVKIDTNEWWLSGDIA